MRWQPRKLNNFTIVSDPEELYVRERLYLETLNKPAKWLESIRRKLENRWRQLSEEEREVYTQKFSNLPPADQLDEKGGACVCDNNTESERPKKRMRTSSAMLPTALRPSLPLSEQLNSDCLLNVLTFLNHEEICQIRLVSKWFDQVACNDYVWKRLFVYHFTGSYLLDQIASYESLSQNCKKYLYRQRFEDTWKVIPKFSLTKKQMIEDVKHDGEYCEDDGKEIILSKYSVMNLDLTSASELEIRTERVHRLGVILSFLNTCGHIPQVFDDLVRIGYSDDFKLIKLSHFCYAVLHNVEHQLYPEREQSNCEAKDEADNDDDEPDEETGHRKRYDRSRVISVGIAPNIEGDFEPFVYYLRIGSGSVIVPSILFDPPLEVYTKAFGQSKAKPTNGRRGNRSTKSVDKQVVTNSNEYTSCYLWESDEKDWVCPHFFNASFTWFFHLSVVSAYNDEKKQLIVARTKEAYPVM